MGHFFSAVITMRKTLIQCSEHQPKCSYPQRTGKENKAVITCKVSRSIVNSISCKMCTDYVCTYISK